MVVLSPQAQSHTSTEAALEALDIVRARTNALIAPLSDRDLKLSHSPLMSPLVWDLGHIAAYEDLRISHRFGGRRLLRPELARVYDAFETPRSERSTMRLLQREEMRGVRARGARPYRRRDRALWCRGWPARRDGDPARVSAHRDDAANDPAGAAERSCLGQSQRAAARSRRAHRT